MSKEKTNYNERMNLWTIQLENEKEQHETDIEYNKKRTKQINTDTHFHKNAIKLINSELMYAREQISVELKKNN